MRTDVTKINEKTPHQDLTEGLMVFAINVNNACSAPRFARTAVFRLKMESVANLTMTIVRAAVFVLKYAHLAQLR